MEHTDVAAAAPGTCAASGATGARPGAEPSPRVVTRGETTGVDGNTTALVDWLGFTLRLSPGQTLAWLASSLETLFNVPQGCWEDSGRGWFGYERRISLGSYGLLAFGGSAQQGTYHVELNSHGCGLIRDWNAIRLWGAVYEANITRIDLAHDDFDARTIDVATALRWLSEGRFTTNGRPPCGELWDDLGSGRGKTLYVGGRKSGKLVRFYEKGKQLGDPASQWVRAEVELKNKGRVVPWEAVTSPGLYFAGAYPALAFLSATQCRLQTIQRGGQISYDAMVNTLRRQGGKALGVMCKVHQGDAAAVLARVVREGVPGRLQGFESAISALSPDALP